MTHRFKTGMSRLLVLLVLGIGACFGSFVVKSESVEHYAIHIVKYQLTDSQNNLLPHDGTKNEGEQGGLSPLEGVQYTVTRMKVSELGNYITDTGSSALSQTLTTDGQGKADFSQLPEGVYQVEELKKDGIEEVMQPVLVQLPFKKSGQSLGDVYIYPKSNFSLPTPVIPGTAETGTVTPSELVAPIPSKKLPNTSGAVTGVTNLYYLLAMVIVLSLFGLRVTYRKVQGR